MILDEVDAGTRGVLERYRFDADAFELLRARVAAAIPDLPSRTTESFTRHSVWLYHWSVQASVSS